MNKIKINEIFYSIQGESYNTGFPFTFIRTSGCSLKCSYCDTQYAHRGKLFEIKDILNIIKKYSCKNILITGGEPLDQPFVKNLITTLHIKKYNIFIETNGSHSLKEWPKEATYIVDIKCPSSKMTSFMNKNIFTELKNNDEVKFVIGSKNDYIFAKNIFKKKLKNKINIVTFSPVKGKFNLKTLAKNILDDKLNVRLGIQLHKYIWPHRNRGV